MTNELKIDPTEITDTGNDESQEEVKDSKEQVKDSETFDATKAGAEHGEDGDNDSGEVTKEVESPRLSKSETQKNKHPQDQATARSETKNR